MSPADDKLPADCAERNANRAALRKQLDDSISRGGIVTDAELDSALAKKAALLAEQGF